MFVPLPTLKFYLFVIDSCIIRNFTTKKHPRMRAVLLGSIGASLEQRGKFSGSK